MSVANTEYTFSSQEVDELLEYCNLLGLEFTEIFELIIENDMKRIKGSKRIG
jgi:phosphosulfolactate synthase (CoM biosynthesis protein A)